MRIWHWLNCEEVNLLVGSTDRGTHEYIQRYSVEHGWRDDREREDPTEDGRLGRVARDDERW